MSHAIVRGGGDTGPFLDAGADAHAPRSRVQMGSSRVRTMGRFCSGDTTVGIISDVRTYIGRRAEERSSA